jgi:hypothetical protein
MARAKRSTAAPKFPPYSAGSFVIMQTTAEPNTVFRPMISWTIRPRLTIMQSASPSSGKLSARACEEPIAYTI